MSVYDENTRIRIIIFVWSGNYAETTSVIVKNIITLYLDLINTYDEFSTSICVQTFRSLGAWRCVLLSECVGCSLNFINKIFITKNDIECISNFTDCTSQKNQKKYIKTSHICVFLSVSLITSPPSMWSIPFWSIESAFCVSERFKFEIKLEQQSQWFEIFWFLCFFVAIQTILTTNFQPRFALLHLNHIDQRLVDNFHWIVLTSV